MIADGRWLQVNERRTKDGGHVSVGADITTLKRRERRTDQDADVIWIISIKRPSSGKRRVEQLLR